MLEIRMLNKSGEFLLAFLKQRRQRELKQNSNDDELG
jgi:hypothetical protein